MGFGRRDRKGRLYTPPQQVTRVRCPAVAGVVKYPPSLRRAQSKFRGGLQWGDFLLRFSPCLVEKQRGELVNGENYGEDEERLMNISGSHSGMDMVLLRRLLNLLAESPGNGGGSLLRNRVEGMSQARKLGQLIPMRGEGAIPPGVVEMNLSTDKMLPYWIPAVCPAAAATMQEKGRGGISKRRGGLTPESMLNEDEREAAITGLKLLKWGVIGAIVYLLIESFMAAAPF